MLNNKGFAVSSVLYTLLIAFLLFLGAALAQFSSSSSLIGKANDDIVNGTQFEAMQVKPNGACAKDADGNIVSNWYNEIKKEETTISNTEEITISNTIVRIKSRYGTIYWPKDFKNDGGGQTMILGGTIGSIVNTNSGGTATSTNGKVKVQALNPVGSTPELLKLKIFYTENTSVIASYGNAAMSDDTTFMGIYDICK